MIFRIAIASTDGIIVNQHFGHAERFHIVEINSNTDVYKFAESRNVTPCCNNKDHEISSFDMVLKMLSDVQAIFVSKIGAGAADYLEHKGLAVYQAPYPIELLLKKIITEKRWEADEWQYLTKN
ncbi:MAG: dinitrogenase iron-molybdenum cofactor biosynthesis protein [Oscillospiraceae bacterium]|nr:dinitrogenase iron-molybdenum cofactor biosynthesis protein [Oscillospiraceae bacterium]MBQ8780717.1 dinitrogenase iron-molybdenum cofactor biosynthesis protein [Oscillospiraceae bacterium]